MLSRQDGNFQDKKTMITFGRFILPLTVVIALGLLFFSIKLFFYTPLNPDASAVMEAESKQIEDIIKDKKEETKEEALPKANIDIKENKAAKEPETKPLAKSKNKDRDEEHVAIVLAKPIKAKTDAVSKAPAPKKETVVSAAAAKPEKPKEEKKAVKAETVSDSKKITKESTKKESPKAKESKKQEKEEKQSAANQKKEQKNTVSSKTATDKQNAKTEQAKKTEESAVDKKSRTGEKKEEKSESTAKSNGQQKTASTVKRWDVQIGVFSDKKNADQIMQKAKSEGYGAYIIEGKSNDKVCYRIRVQGSKDKAQAQKLSDELKKKGYEVYLTGNE